MAGAFATVPAAWVQTSNTPSDNISAAPTGSNRKLVVTLGCEDADAWSITTMQVGGQNPDVTHTAVDTAESTQESRIRQFEWHESTIASMSGVGITYADGTFINPMAITHYWLKDVDQSAATQTQATIITTDSLGTITVSASSNSGDVVVGVVVSSASTWDVTDWDTLTADEVLAGTGVWFGIASSVTTTDTSHVFSFSPDSSVRAAAQVLVHASAGGVVPASHNSRRLFGMV